MRGSPAWLVVSVLSAACQLDATRAVPPLASETRDSASAIHGEPGDGGKAPSPEGDPSPRPSFEGDGAAAPGDGGVGAATDAGSEDLVDASLAAPADCVSAEHAEHTYFFCRAVLSWSAARAVCLSAGADLVIIDDAAENTFVAQNLSAKSWIGLSDQADEATFAWVVPGGVETSEHLVSYEAWAAAAPDNCGGGLLGQQDCVRIAPNGKWDDASCERGCGDNGFAFVCESY